MGQDGHYLRTQVLRLAGIAQRAQLCFQIVAIDHQRDQVGQSLDEGQVLFGERLFALSVSSTRTPYFFSPVEMGVAMTARGNSSCSENGRRPRG